MPRNLSDLGAPEVETDPQPWQPPVVETDLADRAPPTAQEVQDIVDAAHKSGFADGKQAGYAAGISEGRHEVSEAAARLREVLACFDAPLADLSESVRDELLQLVISVSQAIIKRELTVKPVDIGRILSDALESLPAANRSGEIFLHPGEAKRVMQDGIAVGGFKIIEDPTLAPGGCRIVAAESTVDASLHHRIYELAGSVFGRDDDGNVESDHTH